SPQYTRDGRLVLRLDSKTGKRTSLGTVPKADTTCARRAFLASASAPEDVRAMTSLVSSALIGREQVTMTFPDKSPACFSTSFARDQWTAKRTASASRAASSGVPACA